ncbi:LysM peptidoglycan-binding domain-containing protein [Marinifilum sp.]|uniref:LysM peptidoglycan-binding domain-containing protein n=1 Tax=Marinifilum sp. TaxID=2033137 RepID=UPI003BA87CF5
MIQIDVVLKMMIRIVVLIVVIVFMIESIQAQEHRRKSNLKKQYLNNEIEKLLSTTDKDLLTIDKSDDLRLLAVLASENGVYDLSSKCFEKLFRVHKDKIKTSDLINYCQTLIETDRHAMVDSILASYPSNDIWLTHMKEVADCRSSLKELDEQNIEAKPFDIKIFTDYGVSRKGDSIYYCTQPLEEHQINLIETAIILSNRKHISSLVKAEYHDGDILNIQQKKYVEFASKGKNEFIGMNRTTSSKDIFYSVRPTNGKSLKIVIDKDQLPKFPYNSDKFDSSMPYFDEVSQRLYFCSNRSDGYGGWDIYYCNYDGSNWGKPINAGNKINTPFNEIFPTVIPQGLLFASDGRIGKGGFDNYLYSNELEECINLHGFNTGSNDYCLIAFNAGSIGIKKDSLVAYNKGLDEVLDSYLQDHIELMSMIRPVEHVDSTIDSIQLEKTRIEIPVFEEHKIYFDFDSERISETERLKLDSVAHFLSESDEREAICFYGSTDGYGKKPYNYGLAYERILSTVSYLETMLGKGFFSNNARIVMGEITSADGIKTPEDRFVKIVNKDITCKEHIIIALHSEECDIEELLTSYNISDEIFNALNACNKNELQKRKYVFIPVQKIYKIKAGDTLYSIGSKFNTSIKEIRNINHLKSDLIRIGKTLIIPLSKK